MANEKKSFFKELTIATLDYKSFFKTMGKDLLAILLILILVISYTFVLLTTTPQKPWWAEGDNLLQASTLEIQAKTQEINAYLLKFTLLTILISLLALIIFTLFKEWIWKDLAREKYNYKSLLTFIGLNIIIYLITALLIFLISMLAGLSIKGLGMTGTPALLIIFVAFIFLIPLVFFSLHFLNYSGYQFVKTRKFGKTIIDTFKSFSKIKQLLAPYAIIIVIFAVLGTIFNYLFATKDPVLALLAYMLLLIFLSWEKVYSSHFFKRIYN